MPRRRTITPITSAGRSLPPHSPTTIGHANLVGVSRNTWYWPKPGQDIIWTSVSALPTPRGFLGAVLIGQKVYTFGGATPPADPAQWLNTIETLDVQTYQSVSLKALLPQALTHLAVVASTGSIYVVGGAGSTACYVFNSAAGTWNNKADMPKRQYCAAGAVGPDGKIYVIGGLDPGASPYPDYSGSWTHLKTVQCFNPVNGTWSDGKIYVFGGIDDQLHVVSSVEEYDPTANQWTVLDQAAQAMLTPRYDTAAVTGSNGRIYVIGGMHWCSGVDAVEEFNPATKLWRVMTPMPTGRYGVAAAATTDGRIFVLGGWKKVSGTISTTGVIEEGVLPVL